MVKPVPMTGIWKVWVAAVIDGIPVCLEDSQAETRYLREVGEVTEIAVYRTGNCSSAAATFSSGYS